MTYAFRVCPLLHVDFLTFSSCKWNVYRIISLHSNIIIERFRFTHRVWLDGGVYVVCSALILNIVNIQNWRTKGHICRWRCFVTKTLTLQAPFAPRGLVWRLAGVLVYKTTCNPARRPRSGHKANWFCGKWGVHRQKMCRQSGAGVQGTDIETILGQYWAIVHDDGPVVTRHCINVSSLSWGASRGWGGSWSILYQHPGPRPLIFLPALSSFNKEYRTLLSIFLDLSTNFGKFLILPSSIEHPWLYPTIGNNKFPVCSYSRISS